MSNAANEWSAPSGNSFKFETIGDTLEGVVTYIGDWETRVSKFTGIEEQIKRVGVDTGNGEVVYIWPRKGSSMAEAIRDAFLAADLPDLAEGQKLKLRYDADKATGKGNPMKVYKATLAAGTVEPPF